MCNAAPALIIALALCSCTSLVRLPCGDVAEKFSKVFPNKDYVFTLKNGEKTILQVRQVDSVKIVGKESVMGEPAGKTILKDDVTDIAERGSYEPLIPCSDAYAAEMITKITPGKVYQFQLKDGRKVTFRVDRIEDGKVYGKPHEATRYYDSQNQVNHHHARL